MFMHSAQYICLAFALQQHKAIYWKSLNVVKQVRLSLAAGLIHRGSSAFSPHNCTSSSMQQTADSEQGSGDEPSLLQKTAHALLVVAPPGYWPAVHELGRSAISFN
jgi:hypothetical protein